MLFSTIVELNIQTKKYHRRSLRLILISESNFEIKVVVVLFYVNFGTTDTSSILPT